MNYWDKGQKFRARGSDWIIASKWDCVDRDEAYCEKEVAPGNFQWEGASLHKATAVNTELEIADVECWVCDHDFINPEESEWIRIMFADGDDADIHSKEDRI